ncbi:MAG: hypothetical protein AAF488_13990 [Planctomycetota bacterium]
MRHAQADRPLRSRFRSTLHRSLLASALAFGATAPVLADEIHLTNGKSLTGKVTEEDGRYVITLGSGTVVRLDKNQVHSIVSAPLPAERLAQREAALSKGDAAGLYALAKWCKAVDLDRDAERLVWRTIEVDPNHAAARKELGFHRVGAVWLTEEDYQRSLGRLFFDGEWLTPQEHAIAVKKARSAEAVARAKTVFRMASGKRPEAQRQSALAEFRALPTSLRAWTLLDQLESFKSRDRQFAVRELGALADRRYSRHLAHLAVTDTKQSVRDEAIQVLKQWEEPDTVLSFLPYLSSGNDRYRVTAARAVNHFPDRRAAGELIRTAHFVWAGFGRSHIAVVTQRSFVKDYELVSGGTGLVVQEVADPVVDTFQEGVVLDVAIRKAEAFARAASLRRITGQNFGTDFEQWASWWKEETGRLASQESDLPAGSLERPPACSPRANDETETHTGRG